MLELRSAALSGVVIQVVQEFAEDLEAVISVH
jgi:hypothetical protein